MEVSTDRREEGRPAELTPAQSHEQALWQAYRQSGAQAAREELFSLYFPFAKKIAMRHFHRSWPGDIEFPDIRQLACAGLLEALDHFDSNRGVPFRAYAARRISGSILDGIAQANEMRSQITLRNRVRRERAKSLSVDDPDALSYEDALSTLIDMAVGLAVGFMLDDTSLILDEAAVSRAPDAYESLAWKEMLGRLGAEVEALPPREQSIIRRHYMDGMTFDQIGALMGLTKGRISQLHRQAIGSLRSRIARAGHFNLEG